MMQDDQPNTTRTAPMPQVTDQAAMQSTTTESEVAYPVHQILAGSERIFGQPSWVLEGALNFASYDLQGTIKKSEAQVALDSFLQQEDKPHAELLARQEAQ